MNINLRLAAGIRGRIAVKEDQRSVAERYFREATAPIYYSNKMGSPFFSGAMENYLLAGLLASGGRNDEALIIYRSFDDTSIFDRVFRVPSLIDRAKIYEDEGEIATALEIVLTAEELWSSADPEFQPMLDEIADLKVSLESASR